MNFGAHELLETSEALRTKAAEIEQHGMFANMCRDSHLKSILMKHQQQMMNAYQQGLSFMQGRGVHVNHMAPSFHEQGVSTGMDDQTQASMSPNMRGRTLSDQTIATLALNAHKGGSMMAMVWAGECVDPNLRMYHVNGANMCQEMAYEIWSWMNQNGYYQPPTFSTQQMNQMSGMFQPMGNMGQMGMGASTGPMANMNTTHMQTNPQQGNIQ